MNNEPTLKIIGSDKNVEDDPIFKEIIEKLKKHGKFIAISWDQDRGVYVEHRFGLNIEQRIYAAELLKHRSIKEMIIDEV